MMKYYYCKKNKIKLMILLKKKSNIFNILSNSIFTFLNYKLNRIIGEEIDKVWKKTSTENNKLKQLLFEIKTKPNYI